MTSQMRNSLIGVVIVIALASIGAYFIVRHKQAPESYATNATSTSAITTLSSTSSKVAVSSSTGSYTITEVPISNFPAAPAYKTPVVCPSTMQQDVCQSLQGKDVTIISMIDKNKTDFAAWTDLGIIRKEIGDYAGAAQAWNYLTKLYPQNAVAYNDLGDLYMNFVKDYPKSETNLLMAIKINPEDPASYENLFTLYTTTSYKPSANVAVNILKKGIAANPNSVDLQVLLARYYKSVGDSTDARAAYDAAVQIAQKANDSATVTAIRQEESSL